MIKRKILIAEDNMVNAMVLKQSLRIPGYQVDITEDGEAAYLAMLDQPYDALLTDWMMPKMDGMELIKQVRASIENPPLIVVITSLSSSKARKHALSSGADSFLAKPVKKNEVISVLNNLFTLRDQPIKKKAEPPSIITTSDAPFFGVSLVANTGGPQSIIKIFEGIPPTDNVAYFVAQHLPNWALSDFIDLIEVAAANNVNLAADGMQISGGNIYLAQGDKHLLIAPDTFRLIVRSEEYAETNYPSGDLLLKSTAESFGQKSIGVVLSGIGRDCSIGATYVHCAGGTVITQHPRTTAAPFMPQYVKETNPDSIRVHLHDIPDAINEAINLFNKS